jgi:hypothetical protein
MPPVAADGGQDGLVKAPQASERALHYAERVELPYFLHAVPLPCSEDPWGPSHA